MAWKEFLKSEIHDKWIVLQKVGSLGQYISTISIKAVVWPISFEIWSHDRHLITWRHTRTCLQLGYGSVSDIWCYSDITGNRVTQVIGSCRILCRKLFAIVIFFICVKPGLLFTFKWDNSNPAESVNGTNWPGNSFESNFDTLWLTQMTSDHHHSTYCTNSSLTRQAWIVYKRQNNIRV